MIRVSSYVQGRVEQLMREHPQFDSAATKLRYVLGRGVDEVYRTLYSLRFENPDTVLQAVESRLPIARTLPRRRLSDSEYDRIGLDVMRRISEMKD